MHSDPNKSCTIAPATRGRKQAQRRCAERESASEESIFVTRGACTSASSGGALPLNGGKMMVSLYPAETVSGMRVIAWGF